MHAGHFSRIARSRRKRLAGHEAQRSAATSRRSCGTRAHSWEVIKRVAVGVYNDGFIHAGNLAYLALLSLFPFVIVAAAVARLFGQTEGGAQTVNALLETMPPDVADVLRKPIEDVLHGALRQSALARRAGRPVDHRQLHRDDPRHHPPRLWRHLQPPFWEYRLGSIGMIIAAVVLLMFAFAITSC